MTFHDVAFLHSRASIHTTFFKKCGGDESNVATTFPKAVVDGK